MGDDASFSAFTKTKNDHIAQNAHINVRFVAWWLKEENAWATITIRIRMILCLEQPLAQKHQYQIIARMRQNQLFPLFEQTKKYSHVCTRLKYNFSSYRLVTDFRDWLRDVHLFNKVFRTWEIEFLFARAIPLPTTRPSDH